MTQSDDLTERVKAHYAWVARKAAAGAAEIADSCQADVDDCCGPAARDASGTIGSDLYDATVAGSIGCANPVVLAKLEPGEHVLDLGSGGGIDVLLSAARVAPPGVPTVLT